MTTAFPSIPSWGKLRFPYHGPGTDGHQVVPVEGDVQASVGDLPTLGLLDLGLEEGRQLHPPAVDPHEDQVPGSTVLFHQLPGHAGQGPLHRIPVQETNALGFSH